MSHPYQMYIFSFTNRIRLLVILFFFSSTKSHYEKISTFTEFYRRHILYRKNVFDLNIYPMPVHHDEG